MNFLEDIKKYIEKDKVFLIAYYGASTTSFEHVFPNWGEIIRYVLQRGIDQLGGGLSGGILEFENRKSWA